MRRLNSWRALVTGAVAVCAGAVMAQTPPPSAPVTPGRIVPTPLELAPRPAVPPTDAANLPRIEPRAVPRELGKPDEELRLDVRRFAVADSAPLKLRQRLAELTAPYVGAGRGYEDIVNAAAEVTRFLQSELGYYLGYAYIPEQDPKDGVVQIAVLEGRLDRVVLKWPEGLPVQKDVVEAYLSLLAPGSILTVRDVERVVFLVNDLRGMSARFDVEAGREPGTATIVVTPAPESRWGAQIEADGNGSQYLGVYRLGALASYNNLLGRGDGFTVNGLASTTGGLQFLMASYISPVGGSGLKLGATISGLKYKLDESTFPQDVHGDSYAATLDAVYPYIRSRNLNLFTLASLQAKQYNDTVSTIQVDKSIRNIVLGAAGDFRDALLSGGVSTYELSAAYGNVQINGKRPDGLIDSPTYTKIKAGYARLQNVVTGKMLVYMRLSGQWGLDNLDNTEQFVLGGADGVRAYGPGEGLGDSGLLATVEMRFIPPDEWFGRAAREVAFGVFYDWGGFRRRHDASAEPIEFANTGSLAGPGLSATWVRLGQFSMRLSLAWPTLGNPVSEPVARNPRVYFQLTKYFS